MNFRKNVCKFSLLLAILLITFLLQSCQGASPSENLAQLYADAITDSQSPATAKISKNLTAIVADEPNLVWEGAAGSSRLSVITTMSQYAYETYGYKTAYESGSDYNLSETALSWVTAVPQAILYFKGLGYTAEDATNLRFAQALGLPEPTSERMVVGLMVNTGDMFRPCPDPEINDHECELDFPTDSSGNFLAFDENVKIKESSACATDGCTYNVWFANRQSTVYTGSSAFPWTQLGYTYDWAFDAPEKHIGLSEFAVKGGSTFKVVSADTTENYFINNWNNY